MCVLWWIINWDKVGYVYAKKINDKTIQSFRTILGETKNLVKFYEIQDILGGVATMRYMYTTNFAQLIEKDQRKNKRDQAGH